MSRNIEEAVSLLFHKNNAVAYQALKDLQKASDESSQVYPYIDRFIEMLDSPHSYLRTRGLTLTACNARWDAENKIDESIGAYLRHITDPKPITARQCIQLLPMLAKYKPELKEEIVSALLRADAGIYPSSMQPLVIRDIQNALSEIKTQPT